MTKSLKMLMKSEDKRCRKCFLSERGGGGRPVVIHYLYSLRNWLLDHLLLCPNQSLVELRSKRERNGDYYARHLGVLNQIRAKLKFSTSTLRRLSLIGDDFRSAVSCFECYLPVYHAIPMQFKPSYCELLYFLFIVAFHL